MAAASGRPRLCSGPRPGPRRLGPEKAQRTLPGVHHGRARRTGSTPRPPRPPRPGELGKAGPPAGQSGPVEAGRETSPHGRRGAPTRTGDSRTEKGKSA